MRLPNGLRYRLVLAALGMAVVVSLVFSVGFSIAFDLAEDELFEPHLDSDVSTFLAQYAIDPGIADLPRENFIVHIAIDGDTRTLPDYILALGPEDDDLQVGGREYHLVVERRGGDTFYFMFDESDIEAFEGVLLLGMLVTTGVVAIAAVWLSFLFGNQIIRPLSDLARRVAELDVGGDRPLEVSGSGDPSDEISVLSSAIRNFHLRIIELLRREREFSSDVSHELRTPLMSIQGASELLESRNADDARCMELIGRIKRGCLQMTTLTEALLYLARDPASFRDMIEPVSIEKVVNDQIAAVRDVTDKKGIRVNLQRDADRTIETIPAVINIVIGNILKNAVKYTDQKLINVFVTDQEVVVQDYGPGIDKSVQATLFDRFNRGENRQADGTGIGLALVRRFCDQYGWRIDFYSEEEKGTRVAVAF